jgi:hypothetical protein
MQQFSKFITKFMYGLTCIGRPHAHHQVLNNFNSNFLFCRWSVVVALLPPRSNGKTTGCDRSFELMMMGVWISETC